MVFKFIRLFEFDIRHLIYLLIYLKCNLQLTRYQVLIFLNLKTLTDFIVSMRFITTIIKTLSAAWTWMYCYSPWNFTLNFVLSFMFPLLTFKIFLCIPFLFFFIGIYLILTLVTQSGALWRLYTHFLSSASWFLCRMNKYFDLKKLEQSGACTLFY